MIFAVDLKLNRMVDKILGQTENIFIYFNVLIFYKRASYD